MEKLLANDNSKEIKFLTIPEQIALLKEKGLIINDEKSASKLLRQIGYYKLINGYKYPFLDQTSEESKYLEGTTLEHLYELYKFDLVLESIVFRATTLAEITLKSYMVELISKKYGIVFEDYLNPIHYLTHSSKEYTFEILLDEINNELDRQVVSNHPAIMWYKNNYNDKYPFWVLANILSFGIISRLFSLMIQEDKAEIAKEYRLQNFPDILRAFIVHLTRVRNICAHNDVLCLHKYINVIPSKGTSSIYTYIGIKEDPSNKKSKYSKGTKDFMSTLIVLRYLIHDNEQFSNLIIKIQGALKTLKDRISNTAYERLINHLGLVDNWSLLSMYHIVP